MKTNGIIIKTVSLLFAFILLLSSLTGCVSQKDKDESALWFGNTVIKEEYIKYWMCVYKGVFFDLYGGDSSMDEFLRSEYGDGKSYESYIKDWVLSYAKSVAVTAELFDRHGGGLSADGKKAIDESIEVFKEDAGSDIALETALARYGVNTEQLREIFTLETKSSEYGKKFYSNGGKFYPTSEEVSGYYNENYMLVKYMVIYTKEKKTDGGTGLLDESEKAAKQEKIKEIEAVLESGRYNVDELISKYSEADYGGRTDGFVISSSSTGVLDAGIVKAAAGIKPGEYKKVNQSGVTLFVFRLPLPDISELDDDQVEDISSLIENLIQKKKNDEVAGYEDKITVNIDVQTKFNLTKLNRCSKYVLTF